MIVYAHLNKNSEQVWKSIPVLILEIKKIENYIKKENEHGDMCVINNCMFLLKKIPSK